MRVGASEGARYPEGDETEKEGRAALKGRKGEMTGSERARGERGLDTGEKYREEKKHTRGREKQRRADSHSGGWIGYGRRGRDGAIGGRRRVRMYYVHPLSGRCKSNVTAGRWACT